jgi:hypothetical protein
MIINQTIFIFNLKNYEKMFNIKIVEAPTSIIATFINKNKKIRRVPGTP